MLFDTETQTVALLAQEHGFGFTQVTWGYQELFREAIDELLDLGIIGRRRPVVTHAVFDTLHRADKSVFDSVIKAYLDALRSSQRWIVRTPQLFERWTRVGMRLGDQTHFLGIRFFQCTAEGTLGKTPKQMDFCIEMLNLIQENQPDLISPFFQGFAYLRDRLEPDDIRKFVLDSLRLYDRNPQTAKNYLAITLDSARKRVEAMSHEARISRDAPSFQRYIYGLTRREIPIENLGGLDSDDLILRGSQFVACSAGIYLPEVINEAPARSENVRILKTMLTVAAACELCNGFTTVHGTPGVETARDLFRRTDDRDAHVAIFAILETSRIFTYIRKRFPGIVPPLLNLVDLQTMHTGPSLITEVARCALTQDVGSIREQPVLGELLLAAENLESFDDTVAMVREKAEAINCELRKFHEEAALHVPPVLFMPDCMFPLTISLPPGDQKKADLRDVKNDVEAEDGEAQPPEESESDQSSNASTPTPDVPPQQKSQGVVAQVGYFYDEWDSRSEDYRPDWCCVREAVPPSSSARLPFQNSGELESYARQIRRVFERLKPEESRVETRLLEGDGIDLDLFMEYITQGEHKQESEMRFYNKPLTRRRDVAVALLMDVSGSTGDSPDATNPKDQDAALGKAGKTVLDIEKRAAFVLSAGLDSLDDKFGLFGFTGTGRENCVFYVFKDFDSPWNPNARERLFAVGPGSSTRIGAALRHTGWKLSREPAKTRLVLLVSDGKPCDQGYDTESGYAQRDVRKACEELRRNDIHSFCITTTENSPADMELMFPNGRHLILDTIQHLPRALSRAYLRMTR